MSFRTRALGAVLGVSVAAYAFSERSILNLKGVEAPLVKVAECAIRNTEVDFGVIDGLRTEEEQRANIARGVSWTMRSRHLEGKAIDVLAYNGKMGSYSPPLYHKINEAFQACSKKLGIPIVWGGNWKQADLMHFELDRRTYP